jgi:hypothetical protein
LDDPDFSPFKIGDAHGVLLVLFDGFIFVGGQKPALSMTYLFNGPLHRHAVYMDIQRRHKDAYPGLGACQKRRIIDLRKAYDFAIRGSDHQPLPFRSMPFGVAKKPNEK